MGIVVGLLLSFIGGWVLAKLTMTMTERNNTKKLINFCMDTIRNLQNIIKEMGTIRDRTKAIHHDFLNLIDIELTVFGRNREHTIYLPEAARNQVRKFMNDCAIKKAEIAWKLDQFYKLNAMAENIRAEGRGPEAERFQGQATVPLGDAQMDAGHTGHGGCGQA